MTAQITKFYSRAELGMRSPRSVSFNITPEQGGVAVHYGGGGPNPPPQTFAAAASIWLGWQRHHMDGNGWADIAYTAGYDQLGNVYAGRGLGVRTAAQGSNQGNDDYYAFVWIGGGGALPSAAALNALEWLIKYAREKGRAGQRVRPHHDFTSTACPGTFLGATAVLLDGKPINDVPAAPAPKPKPKPTPGKLDEDGRFGPATTREFQRALGTEVDGVISHQPHSIARANPGLAARGNWEFDNTRKGSSAIREHQRRLKKRGLYKDKIDGFAGPNYWRAVQLSLGLKLPVGDREITDPSTTVRKLQEHLNDNKPL
jgi:peptidoglycan hydrolase-like protein with peptidoglycan-binding domain